MREKILDMEVKAYLKGCALRDKAVKNVKALFVNERGDSNMVSVALIIVVAIFLAGLLKDQLASIIQAVVDKVTTWISTN